MKNEKSKIIMYSIEFGFSSLDSHTISSIRFVSQSFLYLPHNKVENIRIQTVLEKKKTFDQYLQALDLLTIENEREKSSAIYCLSAAERRF